MARRQRRVRSRPGHEPAINHRIYYDDGTTFSFSGDPRDAQPPARGVQLIVTENGNQWFTQYQRDYYIWRDGRWLGVDICGLFDWLLDDGRVLFGRMMTNEGFRELLRKAKIDSDSQ